MLNPNLIAKFHDRLSPAATTLVEQLIGLADDRNLALFLVGGPVRDLLLGRSFLDLDIAVEGDTPSLARAVASDVGGIANLHLAFGTASVRHEGASLDLATARTETYARPGVLPSVRAATIQEDLLRRDFTINAMALAINGRRRGTLLDPYQGVRDLEGGLIRVLHDRSFQDDATRILRAVRYASRFGFAIERRTIRWLKRDLRYFDTISSARLHREFVRIFAEDAPEDGLLRLDELGALRAIHPALRFKQTHAAAFKTLREVNPAGARSSYWSALGWQLTPADVASLATRLALTKPQRKSLAAIQPLEALKPDLQHASLKPSALVELLAPFPPASLWAFAAFSSGRTRQRCLDYLRKLRQVRPILRGDDILALGARQGPQVGEVLRRLEAAKLDGIVKTRRGEEELARKLLSGSSRA